MQISINLHVGTRDLTDKGYAKWLAVEESTGLYSLADDEKAAIDRLKETVIFTLDTLEKRGGRKAVFSYLAKRNVEYDEVEDVALIPFGALNLLLNLLPRRRELELAHAPD